MLSLLRSIMAEDKELDNQNLLYFVKDILEVNKDKEVDDVESHDSLINHQGYLCKIKIISIECGNWNAKFVFLVPKDAPFYRDELINAIRDNFCAEDLEDIRQRLHVIGAQHFSDGTVFFDYN